jgi:hypothetical protein
MEYYYDERNQFPSLGLPIPGLGGGGFGGLPLPPLPFGGGGGFGGFGGGAMQSRPVAPPIMRPVVAQPIAVAPPVAVAPPPAPAYAYPPPPPPPMPYGPPMYPPPFPPPGGFGFGGPCGGGLLGGLFGSRRALPVIVDNVLRGFAAFGGKPALPTGDQLGQIRNVFTYLDSAAQFVKRDEQLRFFGGLARDIL